MMKNIDSLAFRLKWLLMSPRARYACLWNRTRSQLYDNRYAVPRKYWS